MPFSGASALLALKRLQNPDDYDSTVADDSTDPVYTAGKPYSNFPDLSKPLDQEKQAESAAVLHRNDATDPLQTVGGQRMAIQHQIDEMKRSQELQAAAPHVAFSGSTGADIKGLQDALNEDPDAGLAQHAINAKRTAAREDAQNMGFGGVDPAGQAGAFQRKLEYDKATQPVQVELAKEKGLQDYNKQFMQFLGMDKANPATAAPAPMPSHEPQAQGGPATRPGLFDRLTAALTGKGVAPGGSAMDWLNARGERAMYDAGFPSEMSDLYQASSFSNLEQLQAMFPGSRAPQHLMAALAEHQTKVGHETPIASEQRLNGMEAMLNDLEGHMNDPHNRISMGADGRMKVNVEPATLQRSQASVADMRSNLARMRAALHREYPGIDAGAKNAFPGLQSPSNRFERIQ